MTNSPSKRVLMIVTSQSELGDTGLPTGFWLPELTHPYFEVMNAGYTIDIASPKGGNAPIDPFGDPRADITTNPNDLISLGFLAMPAHAEKIQNTFKLSEIDVSAYDAVLLAGGTGAIYDFPNEETIAQIIRQMWEDNKIVAALCHGSSALLNVKLSNGEYLVSGMTVTGFTNAEEAYIKETVTTYEPPVYIEDEFPERGAIFIQGGFHAAFATAAANGRLLTGQNNYSGSAIGRKLVAALTGQPEAQRTIKIVAIDHLLPGATEAKVMALMKEEAELAWRYMKAGVIRENYLRQDGKGAMAVLECSSVAEARSIMNSFPLVKAGLIEFEFIPLGTFTPWRPYSVSLN